MNFHARFITLRRHTSIIRTSRRYAMINSTNFEKRRDEEDESSMTTEKGRSRPAARSSTCQDHREALASRPRICRRGSSSSSPIAHSWTLTHHFASLFLTDNASTKKERSIDAASNGASAINHAQRLSEIERLMRGVLQATAFIVSMIDPLGDRSLAAWRRCSASCHARLVASRPQNTAATVSSPN